MTAISGVNILSCYLRTPRAIESYMYRGSAASGVEPS
ncbi:hypothetical protein V5J35_000975 [Endozoicomonas sp. NE40]|uniref:Uncharacterized protein n=1 Tax=Endozoicomonas lisbonensis TaxID=3120522 RepID=A0ABV2SDD3_9GAMM